MKSKRDTLPGLIGWILLLWTVANFGPYLLVYVFSGQPFSQAHPPEITRQITRDG